MAPFTDDKYIRIYENEKKIKELLHQLVLNPRVTALKWSSITKQTPNMKIGYPAQHIASLITGVYGARTGARGDDLEDGTEVKSCSRVDQLDTCKDCKKKVLRIETSCPHCGSLNIKRMNDSKWLFGIKNEDELELLTSKINRVFLTIADYPKFHSNNFEIIRFQAFEIWNNELRHKHFKKIMSNYYYKIFLEHIKINPKKTPAPKNFWPYSYQFYLCNPVKVFQATVSNANYDPKINIDLFVNPKENRSNIKSELMPISLLYPEELALLISEDNRDRIENKLGMEYGNLKDILSKKNIDQKRLEKCLPFIDEEIREIFYLRDTNKISTAKVNYARR